MVPNRIPSEVVVFDLETTGLDPATDRITEIAMLRVRLRDDGGYTETGSWSTLVSTYGKPIPARVTELTGITDAMVSAAPPFDSVTVAQIKNFVGVRTLVAHNAPFDLAFLNRATKFCMNFVIPNYTICTAHLAERIWGKGRYRLDTLATRLGVPGRNGRGHRAMIDCEILAGVVAQMRKVLERASW